MRAATVLHILHAAWRTSCVARTLHGARWITVACRRRVGLISLLAREGTRQRGPTRRPLHAPDSNQPTAWHGEYSADFISLGSTASVWRMLCAAWHGILHAVCCVTSCLVARAMLHAMLRGVHHSQRLHCRIDSRTNAISCCRFRCSARTCVAASSERARSTPCDSCTLSGYRRIAVGC